MASAENIVEGFKTALKITKEAPVVLEVRSGRLFIGTYNEYHSVIYECASDWADFKIIFSQNVAKEIPRAISGGKVNLEVIEDGRAVKLTSVGVKLKLALLDNAVLGLGKLISKYTKDVFWEVDGKEFHNTLERVRHSANDKSIGDVVLRGYHLTKKGDGLEFMASNGASMSVSTVPLKNKSTHEGQILLNPEFHQVSQLLSEETTISFSEDAISVEAVGDSSIIRAVSLLTKGKAFDYDKVLTTVKDNKHFSKFPTKVLFDALKRTDFFTDENQKYKIGLSLDKVSMTITSSNAYGESTVAIEALESNLTTAEYIELSGVSLLNYLSSTKSDTVSFYWKDASSPIRIDDGVSTEVIVLFRQ